MLVITRNARKAACAGSRVVMFLGLAVVLGAAGCRSQIRIEPLTLQVSPPAESADMVLSAEPQTAIPLQAITGPEGITVTIRCEAYSLSQAGGQTSAAITGYQPYGSPGDPMVPYRVIRLGLPPDADLASVEVKTTRVSDDTQHIDQPIVPAPPMATWDGAKVILNWGEGKKIVDGFNENVYKKDAFFPENRAGSITASELRKWQMIQFDFFPVQYNPVKGLLKSAKDVEFVVSYKRRMALRANAPGPEDTLMDDVARRILDNYTDTRAGYASPQADSEGAKSLPRYVIITTNAIMKNSTMLKQFEAFKEWQNLDVLTVTEDARYPQLGGAPDGAGWGGGTGDAAAGNIRGWLSGNYAKLKIQYVLLIGNPDPRKGDVPMKMCKPRAHPTNFPEYSDAPTDHFYAELTGNWDLDGDGVFGEYGDDFGKGGVDNNIEVYVGRIPVYGPDYTTLDRILDKTIRYGRASGALDWRKKILLPMEPSDSMTSGRALGEAIKANYATPNGWTSFRIYDADAGTQPEMIPCNEANVLAAWQKHFGLVTWWTHGNDQQAADVFDSGLCPQLDDTCPSFTFQCSCLNGEPETANNLGYALLKNGAVGTVSASRVSWYNSGETYWSVNGNNTYMAYVYSGKMIKKDNAGKALGDMKMEAAFPPTSDGRWMDFLVFNLYGDPALRLAPKPIGKAEFKIFNDGKAQLDVSKIETETPVSWLTWDPLAPFQVAPGASQVTTVSVDFDQVPAGESKSRLLVHSNDKPKSPYPGGVNVVVQKSGP